MTEQEREHIASMDCWCNPYMMAYGDDEAPDEDEESD